MGSAALWFIKARSHQTTKMFDKVSDSSGKSIAGKQICQDAYTLTGSFREKVLTWRRQPQVWVNIRYSNCQREAKIKAGHLRGTTRTSQEARSLMLLCFRSLYLVMKCVAITKLAGTILLLLSQLLLLRAVGAGAY